MKQAQSVIPNIIDQHAEEATFLWLLRHNAVYAPHYNLKDLINWMGVSKHMLTDSGTASSRLNSDF